MRLMRVAAAFCVMALLACGLASAADGYPLKPRKITDRKLKVALVPVAMNTAYTMTINGAKEEIATKGYNMELIVQAPASNVSTIADQSNILENLIRQQVDAIVMSTESDSSMLPYLRAAAEAGIPLFLFNMTEIDPENKYYISSIGYDQWKAGYDIGKWIVDNYGDQDINMGVLEGYPGILNTIRMDGFKSAIAEKANIKIIASQTANWTRVAGQQVTEGFLTSFPQMNMLYGPYDEMVLGGIVAIKERNLIDKIAVVGFGCTKDGVDSIKAGEMKATIDVGEKGTGYDIIDAVYEYCVLGNEVPAVINRPSKVYDITNLHELDMSIFE